MASAQLNICFDRGCVQVEAYYRKLTVSLRRDGDEQGRVETDDPEHLRRLAKALNQVADFVEANADG